MSLKQTILTLAILVIFTSSCSTVMPGKTKANSKNSAYSEDLSEFRPEPILISEVPVEDTTSANTVANTTYIDQTEKLNTVLDTAAVYARSTIRYVDGFTIQVYGGDNRATAKDYRMDLIRNFPATAPRMVFEQPNYKVRVGRYYTRLEAQHMFTQVKRVFPKAILIPARIYDK